MPRVLVVEPNPGGHRFQAAAAVAVRASRAAEVRLLTSTGALATEEYRTYVQPHGVAAVEVFSAGVPSTSELARVIAQACRAEQVETVVVMDGDLALKTWWYVAARAFRHLPHRPRVIFFLTRYPARLELREPADLPYWRIRVAKAVLLVLARLTGTVHRAAGFAARDDRTAGWLVKRARDPAACSAHSRDRAALRAELGLPADRRIVGIFGGINVRKNPQLVLDAVALAGGDVDLLLAGPMSADIADWLAGLPEQRRRRVIVADGFLPNAQLDRYLAAADIVALVMTLEGPSGIMGKAIAAGVPVVTAGSKTRARELRAVHTGAATEWSADSIADGLRTVLAGDQPAPATSLALPTADAFAAAILGDEPGPPSLPAKVRYRLRHRALAGYLRPVRPPDLVRLGSDYGGWWVPESAAVPGSIAYCAGAGEDITFDLALFERGCIVRVFDPTPRAIEHVRLHGPTESERWRFLPVGLWDVEDELQFYSPPHAEFVSHSVVNLHGTAGSFVAAVKPVDVLVAELGDDHVDILKLDVEGAEHRTIDALLARGPLPRVLCVEFDQPQPMRRVVARVRALQRAGYTLANAEQWNYTFIRSSTS
jgi:FkbM family methyltransferase